MTNTNEVSLLLVEDNDTDYLVFQQIIKGIRDYFVDLTRVATFAEAAQALVDRQFDIIFLDLYLPDSQARDTFDSIRPLAQETPVVILSGISDRQLTLSIVKAGAQDYLVKGEIESVLLEKTIDYSIERKKYQELVERSERKYRTTFESVGVAIGEYDYSSLYDMIKALPTEEVVELLDEVESNLEKAIEIRSMMRLTDGNQAALELFEKGSLHELQNDLEGIYTQEFTKHISQFIRCIKTDTDYFEQEMWYTTPQKGLVCVLNRVRILGDYFGFHRALISSVNITRLKEHERLLSELNEDLEQRVKERTAQLEELNNELESFSYSVSHDLRAPLRAINGFSKMLHSRIEDDLDEKGAHFLSNIEKGATEMSHLIDDLLDFSRMGRKTLQMSVIDVKLMVQKLSKDLVAQVPERDIEVNLGELPPAMGDPAMVRQILVNLLWNSIKYSVDKAKAEIKIFGEPEGDMVRYTVSDNGMGFDMSYADKLFGVFQRLHQDTDIEGTGAGLAIVQRIIKRHGGDITAHGEVGKGAIFSFTLPKAEEI